MKVKWDDIVWFCIGNIPIVTIFLLMVILSIIGLWHLVK